MRRYFATIAKPVCVAVGALLGFAASCLGAPAAVSRIEPVSPPTGEPSVITDARQLLDLSPSEAERRLPVKLRGVVTYFDPRFKVLFAQDQTAGFFVYRNFVETNFHTGSLVEISGVTRATFAPAISPQRIEVLGAAPMPTPHRVSYERLAGGKEDCQFVQVQGAVRTMAWRWSFLEIDLAVGNEHITLTLPASSDLFPTHLIGAVVEARGVCSMKANNLGQMTGFWFYVPNLEFLTVLRPAPADAFAEAARSVKSLLQYNPRADLSERVKVTGTVMLWTTTGKFFIRDESGPLEVQQMRPPLRDDRSGRYVELLPAPPLRAGDRVEVVGYLSASESSMRLVDAEYRVVDHAPAPVPALIDASVALEPQHDRELISLEARLLERETRHTISATNVVLVLQAQNTLFEAELPDASPLTLANNSLLRVTGINSLQTDQWRKGRSFRLLLRDVHDIAVLSAPPRYTPEILARMIGAGSIVMLAAVTWIVVLRRRVAVRTASLRQANDHLKKEIAERHQAEHDLRRAELELRSALAKERELSELKTNFVNVVSHEFRTPLSIILSSSEILDSYLQTLSAEEREQHLRDIKECTRHMATLMEDVLVLGRVEAGKMQFRPVALDVPGFCRRLVDEILSATNRQCPIDFSDHDVEELARGDEGLLRHIFHNLLSNAVKYSPAGQSVQFTVRRENDDAVFTVHDNGIGIPADDLKRMFTAFHRGHNVGQLPGSGLGLVIVKRCVDLHQGHVGLESVEGGGTTVTVRLPLFVKTGHTEVVRRAPAPVAAISS